MPALALTLLLFTILPTRIVGGDEIDPPELFPATAAVVEAATADAHLGLVCGATVIADRWVLTAASCVEGWTADELHVVAGRHRLGSAVGSRRAVTRIEVHPGFGVGTLRPDAALLELDGSTGVTPARTTRRVPDTGTIVGWGDTRTVDRFPDERHGAIVEVTDDAACEVAHGSAVDTGISFCAGGSAEGSDACRRDEGGPLYDDRGRLAGIIGPAPGCAIEGAPRVYTRLAPLRAWIFQLTGSGVTCRGRVPTIAGGDGHDLLVGTAGDDVIVGFGGDDTIDGLGGDDIVCAGAGNDVVDGGIGDDTLLGASGLDDISGGFGDDLIRAGAGDDQVRAGAGHDTVSGGTGDDDLTGGDGDDRMFGRDGADVLDGGSGDDHLAGGRGDDTIDGRTGDDHLLGGTGDDHLDGGGGDDIVRGMGGIDVVSGGGGVDECHGETTSGCEPLQARR